MNDLEKRRAHWDVPTNRAPREEHDMTDSLPYPFEGLEALFTGQDVLEIGPGRGRQFERLWNKTRTYSVCDISPAALEKPVFAPAKARFLISSYKENLLQSFDVIHFWYVLHHVKVDELSDFFRFIARHLRPNGLAIFNSPQTGNHRAWYTGDGIGTTYLERWAIEQAYWPCFNTVVVRKQDDRSSGYLFVLRKS